MVLAALLLTVASWQAAPAVLDVKIPGTVVSVKMVRLPAGKLGDRDVRSIWVGQTEVTWDAYDIWAFRLDLPEDDVAKGQYDATSRPSRPYGAPDMGFGRAGYAAIGITHHAADLFCRWLSEKTGPKFRLPTETEWEYAARAGATEAPANIEEVAWVRENAEAKTQPVGKKPANAFGLRDMLGNVAEWAIEHDGEPVICGGSFQDQAATVGFGTRAKPTPEWTMRDPQIPKSRWWYSDAPFVGFRLVMDD